jgi:hypothetical protein
MHAPSYHAKTLPSYCILGQIGGDGNVAVIILVIRKTGYLRAFVVICLGWGRSADAVFALVADQSIVVRWVVVVQDVREPPQPHLFFAAFYLGLPHSGSTVTTASDTRTDPGTYMSNAH